ncbi:phosphoribosylamine--glycine ligase [Candidatus Woesearchaeota archaeon]|nr:phosphoribosylamine--glycine ligase [Candidatus Woesearchaeota archaeon]
MVIRILLVGNAAREHALAEAIKRSKHETKLYSYMKANNPGIAKFSEEFKIGSYSDLEAIREFALKNSVEFAVVGPEEPLDKGVVDALEDSGIYAFGPKKNLAQIETSKGYTRELMKEYNIRGNPKFKVFTTMTGIEEFLATLDGFVIKPDGLTGGKGVMVQGEHLITVPEALEYCNSVLKTHPAVVIEEKLEGEEFSLQCLTDGKTVIATPPVQDHKRAYDGDKGPNTGGMGSYSCENHLLPFLTEKDIREGLEITKDVARALYAETGELYKGVMYAGLITTRNGVKLIEYNARFGDPEAMNVLSLLKTDFVDICKAIIDGKLDKIKVEFSKKATVCKYAVPEGYPENPVKNKKVDINNIPKKAKVYFASVDNKIDSLYMTGSRAIAVVGVADTLYEAEQIAEMSIKKIKGPVFYRSDIGTKQLISKRIRHMNRLRK